MVCVSLCCPFAAYGQTTLTIEEDFIGWRGMFMPETANIVADAGLKQVEDTINAILLENKVRLLDSAFLSKSLPGDIAENLKFENHNEGSQYLHGIFQIND